jgi:hypothetical protein
MLEVIASICTILSLGIQITDIIGPKAKKDEVKLLAFLKALSVRSKSWKEIHLRYYSIDNDIQQIVFFITRHNNSQEEAKKQGDIAPNELKKYFESGTIGYILPKFKRDLEPFIHTVQNNISEFKNKNLVSDINIIRQKGYPDIAESIEIIIDSQKSILSVHTQFCNFLNKINEYLSEDWTVDHVNYVLQQRKFLRTEYREIINSADKILMNFLTLFNFALDEYNGRMVG